MSIFATGEDERGSFHSVFGMELSSPSEDSFQLSEEIEGSCRCFRVEEKIGHHSVPCEGASCNVHTAS